MTVRRHVRPLHEKKQKETQLVAFMSLGESDPRLPPKSYCTDKVCVAVYVCRGVSQSRVSTFPHSNFSLSQSSLSTRQFALSGFFICSLLSNRLYWRLYTFDTTVVIVSHFSFFLAFHSTFFLFCFKFSLF